MGLAAGVFTVVALVQKSLALLLLPFITHVLDPDVYGLISLVTVVATVTGILLCSPVENAVFRWTARQAPESAGLVTLCSFHALLVVPALGIVAFVALRGLDGKVLDVEYRSWALVLLGACLMAGGIYYGTPLLRARDQLGRFVICSGASIAVNFSLKIYLVFVLKMGLDGWIYSELAASATLYLFVVVLARSRLVIPQKRDFVTLLAYAIPLLPHRVAFWGLTSLSRPILAVTATLHQLGIFSLAANCMAVSALIVGEINKAVLVEYGREETKAPTGATRHVARVQIAAACVVPSVIGLGAALAGPIVFAPEYQGAYPVMGILVVAQWAYALYLVPMNYICQTLGDTRFAWFSSCAGAAIVLGILLLLGRGTTAVQAAAVTSLAYLVMAGVAFETCRRSRIRVAWRTLMPTVRLGLLLYITTGLTIVALCIESRAASCVVSAVGLLALLTLCLSSAWSAMLSRRRGRALNLSVGTFSEAGRENCSLESKR